MKDLKKNLMAVMGMMMMAFLLIPSAKTQANDVIIVLDPGHGGAESGATRTHGGVTYKEEVLNQIIANYCKAELETYEGVKVYMTRTSVKQKAQNRETRVNIAKAKKANALISIHINATAAYSQTGMSGAHYIAPSTSKYPASKSKTAQEARNLGKTILTALNAGAGIKSNGAWVDDELGIILFGQKSNYTSAQAAQFGISKTLINRKFASIIVEHCFVNNPNDCKKYLKTNAQLKKLGVADAAGIAKFYGLKKKGEAPAETENTAETEDNTVLKGVVTKGSSLYLYNDNGELMKGFVKYKGKYYYANNSGKLYTGWKTYKGNKYYFNKTLGVAKTSWQTIGKYKYYFAKNGIMQKKWVKIGSKKYYFSKVNGRLLTNHWLKYNGKWYYLDQNGTPLLNCTKQIGKKTYTFKSSGVCTNKK